MSASVVWRGAVVLLWALALCNALACRGLFWDASSFLIYIIEAGQFHAVHTARAHVLWATQWPVMVALELGVTDTALLSMAYSFGLFALPVGLYHLALYRVRHTPPLLAAVLAIVAVVYLPNAFFIVGEFHAAYAAATAAAAVALTTRYVDWRDGTLLCALGFLCLRSYEAMIYLAPLLAAMIAWAVLRLKTGSAGGRLLGLTGAGFFLGAAIVSGTATIVLWDLDYSMRVRAAAFDFWQNLQFMIGIATLGLFGATILLRPAWLGRRAPYAVLVIGAAALAVSPWLREINPETRLFPPAHYVARTGAGALLMTMLAALWLFVAWTRRPPRLFTMLRDARVGRRLVLSMGALLATAAVPDLMLTRMWTQYLDRFQSVVVSRTGTVSARDIGFHDWPGNVFRQDWSYPALSLLLRRAPTNAVVMPATGSHELPAYDPACGLPAMTGYSWRRR